MDSQSGPPPVRPHLSECTTLPSPMRGSHPADSRSGLPAKPSTYPRHRYATGSTSAGMPSAPRIASFDSMLTHPTPTPSALAASQRFCTAQHTLYTPVWGIEPRPMTNGPNRASLYVTHTLTGASSMPSSFSDRYRSRRRGSPSSADAAAILSASNDSLILSLAALSLTTTKSHGCENPTDGAWCAALSIRASVSSGTGLSVNPDLTSRLAKTALYRPDLSPSVNSPPAPSMDRRRAAPFSALRPPRRRGRRAPKVNNAGARRPRGAGSLAG